MPPKRRPRRARNAEPTEPNCSCPNCGRDHRVTSLDFLEELDSPLVCILREGRILAVGKFTDETLLALSRPGDELLDECGQTYTLRPRFRGEGHRLD